MGGDGGRRKRANPETYGTTACPGSGQARSTSRGRGRRYSAIAWDSEALRRSAQRAEQRRLAGMGGR